MKVGGTSFLDCEEYSQLSWCWYTMSHWSGETGQHHDTIWCQRLNIMTVIEVHWSMSQADLSQLHSPSPSVQIFILIRTSCCRAGHSNNTIQDMTYCVMCLKNINTTPVPHHQCLHIEWTHQCTPLLYRDHSVRSHMCHRSTVTRVQGVVTTLWSPSTPCSMSNHIKYSAHDSSNSAFYVLSEIVCDPNFAWNNIFSFNGSALVLAWAGRRLNKNVAKGQNSVIKRVNGRDINKINVKIQNGTKNKMIKHTDRMKHKNPALQANIITTAELICLQSKDSYLCLDNPKSSANTKLTRLRRCLTMTPLLTVLTMSMVKSVCPVIHNISQCWLFSVSTTWWSLVWWPLTLQCHTGQKRTNNTQ